MQRNDEVAYGEGTLPSGIRSRFVQGINGLTIHILEAGFEDKGRPCLLLLHGFPELAYSWRKQILPLAGAGFHVVAPDQRGYGRTTGWDAEYGGDVGSYRFLNLVKDALALVYALGQVTGSVEDANSRVEDYQQNCFESLDELDEDTQDAVLDHFENVGLDTVKLGLRED